MIALLLVVMVLGADVRGSTRWIDVGFFRFQPSEFGKLLLALFLAGVLAERAADRRAADHRSSPSVWPPFRRCSSSCSRTSARRSSTAGSSPLPVLRGTRWRHLGLLGCDRGSHGDDGAVVRSVARRPTPRALPARPAHGVPRPHGEPAGRGLQHQPVDHCRRRRRYCRPRRRGATQTNLDYLPEHHTDFVSPRSPSSAASSVVSMFSCSISCSSGGGYG